MKQLERPDLAYYFDDTTEVAKTLNEITFNAGGQCLIDIIYEDDKLWLAAGSRVEVFGLNFYAEVQEEIAPINVGSDETYFVYVSDAGALSMSTQEPFWNNYACGYYYNQLRAVGKVQVVSGAIRFLELDKRSSIDSEEFAQVPMVSRLLVLESHTPGANTVSIPVKGIYEITLIGGGGGGGGGSYLNNGGAGGDGEDTTFDGEMGTLIAKGNDGTSSTSSQSGRDGADGLAGDIQAEGGDGSTQGGVSGSGGVGYGAGGGGGVGSGEYIGTGGPITATTTSGKGGKGGNGGGAGGGTYTGSRKGGFGGAGGGAGSKTLVLVELGIGSYPYIVGDGGIGGARSTGNGYSKAGGKGAPGYIKIERTHIT